MTIRHDALVRYAFWRAVGRTQDDAAAQAGISGRSGQRAEKRPDWPEIKEEGRVRWLHGLIEDAREALSFAMLKRDDTGKVVSADGRLALSVLERLESELAPAPQTLELRALLTRLDVTTLPDEVIAQLASGKNVLGVLLNLLAAQKAPLAPRLPAGTDGEIVVDPDSVPE